MAREILQEKKRCRKKFGLKIGKEYLVKIMNGIKVKIKTTDQNNNEINCEGFICRRINVDLYEVWSEENQTLFLLDKSEFEEIEFT